MKEKVSGEDEQAGRKVRASEDDVRATLTDWPATRKRVAEDLINRYGEPNEATFRHLSPARRLKLNVTRTKGAAMPQLTQWMGHQPAELRRDLQEGSGPLLSLRRGTVVVSLIGIAAMALTTLLQTGVVKRLPDPPLRGCDTKKVNSCDEAYSYGGPDSPVAITGHGVNMVLASMGGLDRARRQPWLPLVAAVAAGAQAMTAARYLFHTMPKVDKAWGPYCIVDALTHFATVACTLPEAIVAMRRLARRDG